MVSRDAISKIKQDLSDHVGNKVKFASKLGRKKRIVRSGVIESIYPSVFTIKMDANEEVEAKERVVSYSYADVLTRAVELALYE